jgi:hypothetical protein
MGRTGFGWLRLGSSGGLHKENRILLDKLSDYQLLKEYPAPWSKQECYVNDLRKYRF